MPSSHPRFPALLLTVAAALIPGAQAVAQPNPTRPAAVTANAFLGQWELDLSRMPDTYGTPPKRVLYTFEDVGGGEWRTKIDITGQDGNLRHMAVKYRRDGVMVPGEGEDSEADGAAINSPAPNVLVMSLMTNKALGSVRVYAVSPDGKEMTESAAGMTAEGATFVRNFHYKRIR